MAIGKRSSSPSLLRPSRIHTGAFSFSSGIEDSASASAASVGDLLSAGLISVDFFSADFELEASDFSRSSNAAVGREASISAYTGSS